MSSETTTAVIKTALVACCEDAAEWRLHRAAEFHPDAHKLAAVDALVSAAEDIARLPDNDPRLWRLARVWNRLGHQQRMLAFSEHRRAVCRAAYNRIDTTAALLALVATVDEGILRQGRTRIDVPRRNRRPKIANTPPGVQP